MNKWNNIKQEGGKELNPSWGLAYKLPNFEDTNIILLSFYNISSIHV